MMLCCSRGKQKPYHSHLPHHCKECVRICEEFEALEGSGCLLDELKDALAKVRIQYLKDLEKTKNFFLDAIKLLVVPEQGQRSQNDWLTIKLPDDVQGLQLTDMRIKHIKKEHAIPKDWVLLGQQRNPSGLKPMQTTITFGTVYHKAREEIEDWNNKQDFADTSRRISASLRKRSNLLQDIAFQPLGMKELFASASRKMSAFCSALHQIKKYVEEHYPDVQLECLIPPLKSEERADDKAQAKYGGDATYIKDLLRGTLVVHTKSLARFYDVLHCLADVPFLRQENRHFVQMEDRFQKPMSGGYSDTQWILNLHGHLSEVQVTMEAFASAKNIGHSAFEELRRKTESLLLAAIRRYPDVVRKLLETKADPNAICDKHGLSPLHFSAMLGEQDSVVALLENGANPFACEKSHKWPMHRAILEGHISIVEVLLRYMKLSVDAQETLSDPAADECETLQNLMLAFFADGWPGQEFPEASRQEPGHQVTDFTPAKNASSAVAVKFRVHHGNELLKDALLLTERLLLESGRPGVADAALERNNKPLLDAARNHGFRIKAYTDPSFLKRRMQSGRFLPGAVRLHDGIFDVLTAGGGMDFALEVGVKELVDVAQSFEFSFQRYHTAEGLNAGLNERHLLPQALALHYGSSTLNEIDVRGLDLPSSSGGPLGIFLGRCPAVQKLWLSGNSQLGQGDAISSMAYSLNLNLPSGHYGLRTIYLQNCNLSDTIAPYLGKLMACCPQLMAVMLNDNPKLCSTEGFNGLRDGLGGHVSMEKLYFAGCAIDPACGPALGRLLTSLPKLTKVDLRFSKGLLAEHLQVNLASIAQLVF